MLAFVTELLLNMTRISLSRRLILYFFLHFLPLFPVLRFIVSRTNSFSTESITNPCWNNEILTPSPPTSPHLSLAKLWQEKKTRMECSSACRAVTIKLMDYSCLLMNTKYQSHTQLIQKWKKTDILSSTLTELKNKHQKRFATVAYRHNHVRQT